MTPALAPLRVTAHLAAGIAQTAPWGIALDGLLAAELWAAEKARLRHLGLSHERARDCPDPPDLDLPLARCRLGGDELWHWAATCARPDHDPGRIDVHTWTGRVDARHLEQTTSTLPKVVSDRQGRYRARRMPLLVTPCAAVTWQAVGDLDRICELLAQTTSIGKKRRSGEGHVLRWDVSPAPDLDELTAGHLHPDGTLGRPTPVPCRQHLAPAVVDGGLGAAGIRPPYMHPSRQHDLYLPAGLS